MFDGIFTSRSKFICSMITQVLFFLVNRTYDDPECTNLIAFDAKRNGACIFTTTSSELAQYPNLLVYSSPDSTGTSNQILLDQKAGTHEKDNSHDAYTSADLSNSLTA
jgi:hypothetical protein